MNSGPRREANYRRNTVRRTSNARCFCSSRWEPEDGKGRGGFHPIRARRATPEEPLEGKATRTCGNSAWSRLASLSVAGFR
jgi:hypothetical protein